MERFRSSIAKLSAALHYSLNAKTLGTWVRIQHHKPRLFKRLQKGQYAASSLLKQQRRGTGFRGLNYQHIYQSVSIFKEYAFSNLLILNNHDSQEILSSHSVQSSIHVFLSVKKWQHYNYSVKVNRPQIWFLNLSEYLISIATNFLFVTFFIPKITFSKNFHKVNL